MDKILISGCSYSYGSHSYGNKLKGLGYEVEMLSYPGQSNIGTIYKLYNYITKNNIKNTNVICQLTWLHRFGAFNTMVNKWMDYQPNSGNVMPSYNEETDKIDFEIDLKKGFTNTPGFESEHNIPIENYNEMLNMYTTYLKYHYDETEAFNFLMFLIDTFESLIEKTGNKVTFIYWPEISNDYQLQNLKERRFLKIENEYSILKWSTKNNLLDGSSHLSDFGHLTFANIVKDFITN